MKITVVGGGYVGITTSVALASSGHTVHIVEINKAKVNQLNKGKLPFYEDGVEEKLRWFLTSGQLSIHHQLEDCINESDAVFIAVGTPSLADGSADLTAVDAVAEQIGSYTERDLVVVTKSTVPVGSGEKINQLIRQKLSERGVDLMVDTVSNPEFLREGKALYDALHPDRIVIGTSSDRARHIMKAVYHDLHCPVIYTTIENAEMIKYASNAFLAMKISYVNELARLCERTNTNVQHVAEGIGLDKRIGSLFLNAGIGYGGSCFPKDVKALEAIARQQGLTMHLLEATMRINETQTEWFVNKLQAVLHNLGGKKIALLGLSFKPDTDDIREAASLKIIHLLTQRNASISVYDPQAMENVKNLHPQLYYASSSYDALKNADAALLVTEWEEFKHMDWEKAKMNMKQPIVMDGRNALSPSVMKKLGFYYDGVGLNDTQKGG
ncbi:UDP-glucose dehydrogenase family protein [Pontibacillus salicampi]|uniref:UDP-glucose 6-dehydrogenase n=1 Tax=Pontibacillus salicampi TaxID=1449801 RepID=A0ABV6LQE0_9BACI